MYGANGRQLRLPAPRDRIKYDSETYPYFDAWYPKFYTRNAADAQIPFRKFGIEKT
jgi:hypothetical protein